MLTSGHGHRLDQLCIGRLAGRLRAYRLARSYWRVPVVAEVPRGAIEAVGVHEFRPGRAVLGTEERSVRSEGLRGGEELWIPFDEQIAREEVELLASGLG